jgi:hypothetical protein
MMSKFQIGLRHRVKILTPRAVYLGPSRSSGFLHPIGHRKTWESGRAAASVNALELRCKALPTYYLKHALRLSCNLHRT